MKYKLCMILAAGLLMACSSDDDITTPKEEKPVVNTELRPIYVEVSERPMVVDGQEAKERGMETRATETTTGSLTGFDMHGVYGGSINNYSASKSDETWTVTPDIGIWPSDKSVPVSFYAHTHGSFQANSGNPYVNFTVPEDAFNQFDLLVAKANVSWNEHSGIVPLTFDHACAAVAFNIQKKSELGEKLTVHSVVLKKVYKNGKYNYSTGWYDVKTQTDFTMTNGDIEVTTDLQALPANELFMIPQTCTADTKLDITYTYSGQTKSIEPISLAGITWEAGKKYTINIVLGTGLIK